MRVPWSYNTDPNDEALAIRTRTGLKDGKDIGVVTSASFSRYLMQFLAMVHLLPAHTGLGTKMTFGDQPGICEGTVVQTPFYDPKRLRVDEKELGCHQLAIAGNLPSIVKTSE